MSTYQKLISAPYFFRAILLHIFILILLIFSFEFPVKNIVAEKGDSNIQIIQAEIVNPAKINTPPKIISAAKIISPDKKTDLQKKPEPVVSKSQEIAAQKKIILADAKLQQAKIRQQLLADLAQQKKAQRLKKRQQQKAAAAVFAKKMKELAAKSLQKQLQQEQNRLSALHARKLKGEIDHYRALILQVISQNWRLPGVPDKNLAAELLIRLAPGGTVLDVQVAKSSGNLALDHSAQTAVFRASPLPVPSDSDAFEPFRQFVLKVRPENIQAAG